MHDARNWQTYYAKQESRTIATTGAWPAGITMHYARNRQAYSAKQGSQTEGRF